MPIYEYQCQGCGIVFEEILKQFDVDEYPCPDCKGVGLRLISRPSLQFKGTGWNYTDGPPNANWGKPSASEAPYHNPGIITVKQTKKTKKIKETAKDSSTEEAATSKASA